MAKIPPKAELDSHNFYYGPFHLSEKNCTVYVPKGTGDLIGLRMDGKSSIIL